MDEVRQYSKEWFVNKGQSHIDVAKNVHSEIYKEDCIKEWKFAPEEFTGTKEEMQAKFDELKPNLEKITEDNIFSYEHLIDEFGGVDAVFELMDENGDGKITVEEVNNLAAADTEEFADEVDTNFSARDLQVAYNNAMAADGGKVESGGNIVRYTYKDGSVTDVEKAPDGHIFQKTTVVKTSKNEREFITIDYDNKIKTEKIIDSKGRTRYASVDAPGRLNDSITTTKFSKNGEKVKQIETPGRIITSTYDKNNKILKKKQELKYKADGIVGNTKQKDIGDCWVLSGVNALKGTKSGAQIIKQSIQKNPNGSVTVTLKGVDKSYTFTPEEIGARDYQTLSMEYADGDIDMNLIEMAIGKYRLELLNSTETATHVGFIEDATNEDPLNAGYIEDAMVMLTGKEFKESFSREDMEEVLKKKLKSLDSTAITVSFRDADTSFKNVSIVSEHAYSILKVSKDNVYVVNPWDSSKALAYPKEKFLQNCDYMASMDLD